ncbi:MAG: divergent PAP2 family protein [Eubacteriales bacterium]|nr:divergent PAP2 family protein [Eubacteriales bacterium]
MKYITPGNQILISVIAAWAMAQISKTLITMYFEKKFIPERLIGPGGMPSSHSATVCALAVSSALRYSLCSFEFSISLVLAIIVMHDAMNVRLETGKQAKVINAMLKDKPIDVQGVLLEKQLKELIGHTPTQVVVGAALGSVVALLVNFIVNL